MTGSPRKLPLPFGDAPPQGGLAGCGDDAPVAGLPAWHDRGRLWLCLYFPQLPLEVFAGRAGAPLGVLTDEKKRPVIFLCNDAAARRGVRAGMPVNAALALSPDLEFRSRERGFERDALSQLAAWATRFTPVVSFDPCGALLLEIAASLRLFGGCDTLRAAVIAGARESGHVVTTAVAPTARAALWLARSGQDVLVTEIARLPGVLARLPMSALGWPQAVRQSLRRMGVNQLGECMRLPRDGLARRIGESCLSEIDEALGRRPELRHACHQATQFRDELELPAETRETGLLVEALRILLCRLNGQLQSRQAGAQILWVGLRHRTAPATLLRIGLLRPSANIEHLEGLAAIHLAATSVPALVTSITLAADVADAPPGMHEDLLGCKPDQGERMTGLVERLRMRLGVYAVHGIRTGREHRPEHAWQAVHDPVARRSRDSNAVSDRRRPLWILERPTLLNTRAGAPVFHGPLAFESGPERIETGWWDGRDIRRDYYVACSPHGVRVWVFNDRRGGNWYLHGLFG